MPRRDAHLPIGDMRRKANPAVLEEHVHRYLKLLKVPDQAAQYMERGALADLAEYAGRNVAVTGYLTKKLFDDLCAVATRQDFPGNGGPRLSRVAPPDAVAPRDCIAVVSMHVHGFTSTHEVFSSNSRTVIESSRDGTTKIGAEWTGYGANFNVDITVEFRAVDAAIGDAGTAKLFFEQRVTIAPDRTRRDEYTATHFKPPPSREFEIGKVLNLMHQSKDMIPAELSNYCGPLDDVFPRHNATVREIEAGLGQLGSLVDMVVGYLATLPPLHAATSRQSMIAMPWGPARHEIQAAAGAGAGAGADADADAAPVKKEAVDGDAAMDDAPGAADAAVPLIGTVLGNALDRFHADQKMMRGMGTLGTLMQRLLLLKNYATHFQECFASIDHYMVRAFMKGIGDHNAMLFENRAPLDPLLNKIAMFQAGRAGIEMSKAGIDITGCSVEVQVRLPGKSYYEPLMGLPSVEPRFEGELSFGLGSKPIPVAGEYTRQVFVLPTESDGSAASRPDFRIMAETEYKNTPVVVVIGTPDGKSTAAKAVFLLVDTWAMRMALEISAIPSNKTFAKAMCLLPPEMASFAKAIRACDMAEGGLDLHVIYLRPLLASALDIDEDDLKGDPDWMTQLVGLMRGGVSLQSIAQGKGQGQGQARRSGADDAEGYVNVGAPKYDLALMKTQTAKLEQQMWKQGEKDHYKPPPEPQRPPPEPMPRYRSMAAAPCYRSMGAASYEAEEPRYNACSASAPARAPAPPAADRSAPPAPPPAGARGDASADARGDASVEAIADSLKGQGLDDRDFMATLLKRAEQNLRNSEAVLGASITIPDCANHCYFAKGKVPDNKTTSDYIAPGNDTTWQLRPNLNAASKTIWRMLAAHAALGKPVPTTRLAVFGVFVEWETNLLTGLMSGSIDPTKTMFEAISEFANVQK